MHETTLFTLEDLLQIYQMAGIPVMPVLLLYCDDELFELYMSCYNVRRLLGKIDEQQELVLLRASIRECRRECDKTDYKVLAYLVEQLLLNSLYL